MPKIIAITGGIGSGKSIVSRILRILQYPVYDCDSRAKALMDTDMRIKERIRLEIAEEAIFQGNIDRRILAEKVFADEAKLRILNSICHTAVRADIQQWSQRHGNSPLLFVETAIMFTSGLNSDVDAEWRVTAPAEMRIQRVIARNGLPRTQIEARMDSQLTEEGASPLPH